MVGLSAISIALVVSLVVAIVVVLAFAGLLRLVGRPVFAVAIGLAVVGLAVMAIPFGLKTSDGTNFYGGVSNRCSPPIVSTWRREHNGLAPLPTGFPSCVNPARHRLEVAGVMILGGALIAIVPRRRHARPSTPVPA